MLEFDTITLDGKTHLAVSVTLDGMVVRAQTFTIEELAEIFNAAEVKG